MALTTLTLNIPASNGVGIASNAQALDAGKTFVFDGTLGAGEELSIEATQDVTGVVGWQGVVGVGPIPQQIQLDHTAAFYRVRRRFAVASSAPIVQVAATAVGVDTYFTLVPPVLPAGTSGVGAAADLTTAGTDASFSMEGTLGATEALVIEGSQDGLTGWTGVCSFVGGVRPPNSQEVGFVFYRVRRLNSSGNTLTVFVGTATSGAGGGGGFPGFGGAPPAVTSASAAGAGATASRFNHTHALDILPYNPSTAGMQASGVVQQIYGAPTATPSALTMTATQIPFGAATGVLTQSAKLTWTDAAGIETLQLQGSGPANVFILALRNTTVAGTTSFGSVRFFYDTTIQSAQLLLTHIGGSTNAFTASVSQSAVGADDQFVASGVAAGGQPPLIVWTQNKDVALGASAKNAAAATRGFVFLPTTTAPPTGVPTLDGGATTSARKAAILDDTNFRLYGYMTGAWHFAGFYDYSPTATRIPFGLSDTALTDSASLFYTSGTGILQSPLVETNTVGGFGGGGTLTLENNHAAPATTLSLLAGAFADLAGTLRPEVTGTRGIGTSARVWGEVWGTTVFAGTVTGFGGGNILTLQNNNAAPLSSINLTATDIQITVPAVSGLVPTAANTSIGTAANY
jgi:hypothetical protein